MEIKQIYVSNDGMEWDSIVLCRRHELVIELKREIQEKQKALLTMQEVCTHSVYIEKDEQSHGGIYSENIHWVEYTCTICEKQWKEYI